MSTLRSAIGEKRIDDTMLKAEVYLNEDGRRFTRETPLIPMGGGQDSVEELAWVPRAWRCQSQTLEALRSLGTPWLLTHGIVGARKDAVHWPAPGFGHFLCAQRGGMLACLVPGEPVVQRGSSIDYGVTFLSLLPWKELGVFL